MRPYWIVVDPKKRHGNKGPYPRTVSASVSRYLWVSSPASDMERGSLCHSPSRRSLRTASRRARAAAVSVCDWMRKYMWKCHSRFRLSTTVLRSVWGGAGVDLVTIVIVLELWRAGCLQELAVLWPQCLLQFNELGNCTRWSRSRWLWIDTDDVQSGAVEHAICGAPHARHVQELGFADSAGSSAGSIPSASNL